VDGLNKAVLQSGAMDPVDILFAAYFVITLLCLYYESGIHPEDGHIQTISMVVAKDKPFGHMALAVLNVRLFVILKGEYLAVAWLSWSLLAFVISFDTDVHEAVHTAFFWALSAVYMATVAWIASTHDMWMYTAPLGLVIVLFAVQIVYNVAWKGIITYSERHKGDVIMHSVQSLLELSFALSIGFFFFSYRAVA